MTHVGTQSPIRMSTESVEIIKALAAFQGEITQPKKNREVTVQHKAGGQHSFKYSELGNSIEHVKAAWKANGLAWFSVIVYPETPQLRARLVTRLSHTSGQWIETDYMLPFTNDPKQFAGECTYGRRYSYNMLTGIAADADADEMPPQEPGAQNNTTQPRNPRGACLGKPQGGPTPNGPLIQPASPGPSGQSSHQGATSLPGGPAASSSQPTQSASNSTAGSSAPKTTATKWSPNAADLKYVADLVKDKTRVDKTTGASIVWNGVQVAEYIAAKYRVEDLSDLNQLQFAELRMMVRHRDVKAAFEDLKPGEFHTFEDTPIAGGVAGEPVEPVAEASKGGPSG